MWISLKRSGKVLWMICATERTYSEVTCMIWERENPDMSTTITRPATCDFGSLATASRQR